VKLRQNGRSCTDGSDELSVVICLSHRVHRRFAAENRPHAAEPAGQHDHLRAVKIRLFYRTVRLYGDAVPGFDHPAADAGKLHLHTAAAQNVARRNRFHRLKAGTKNHNNHF